MLININFTFYLKFIKLINLIFRLDTIKNNGNSINRINFSKWQDIDESLQTLKWIRLNYLIIHKMLLDFA